MPEILRSRIILSFDNIESIKKAVEIGAGIALLPEPALRSEVKAGSLVALPLANCRMIRPVGIIQHRQHKLGAAASKFISLLRGTSDIASSDPGALDSGIQEMPAQSNGALNGHVGPTHDHVHVIRYASSGVRQERVVLRCQIHDGQKARQDPEC